MPTGGKAVSVALHATEQSDQGEKMLDHNFSDFADAGLTVDAPFDGSIRMESVCHNNHSSIDDDPSQNEWTKGRNALCLSLINYL